VQESLAQSAALAKAQRIELDLESASGVLVWGDQESLRTLVDNVVGNAVKYSPGDTTVRVRLTYAAEVVQLDVIDEGPGVAIEQRARVFDRFYRAPNQMQAGSGLGLAIAKSVADRHGATIELSEGSDAKGLRVTLRLAAHRRRTE
jgi:two-component system, OmpR family, sensor histidine kinase QseC